MPSTEMTVGGEGDYQGTPEVSCVLCRPNCPRMGRPQVGGPRVDSCEAASGMCPEVLPVTWPCACLALPFSLECPPVGMLNPSSHF